MRNGQEKATIRARVDETADFWSENHFSITHLYASLAGILELDDYYQLEGVVKMLRELQLLLANRRSVPNKADYVMLLGDLANEFEWQSHHGIRLYEPL